MKSLPFFSSPEDRHFTFDMLDHLRIIIETIEQDFITLPRFWDEFLKVVGVLHLASDSAKHIRFCTIARQCPMLLSIIRMYRIRLGRVHSPVAFKKIPRFGPLD
jgi:hypothetical protein